MSFWEQPEHVRLTYLPIGRYYVRSTSSRRPPTRRPCTYTLIAHSAPPAPACTSAADCAGEYRNQIFRGECSAGACVAIDGDGAVAAGRRVRQPVRLRAGLACPSFFFVAERRHPRRLRAELRRRRRVPALGAGYVCTTYLQHNFCVQQCTTDDAVPDRDSTRPADHGPWYRLTCDVADRSLPALAC